jgi:SpoVK/Ycf46/Vps4 family AAA+-type ATPase
MNEPAVDVVELLVTTSRYDDDRSLEPDDLPPRYRRVFWTETEDGEEPGSVQRPLTVTEETAKTATGVERPWEAISEELFTERDGFDGTLALTEPGMAISWLLDRVDDDRLLSNPVLAKITEESDRSDEFSASYEDARNETRPIQADRVWIDALLDEYFDEEEDAEMLDLVNVHAPEEIETTLKDLVLTGDQEGEIQKLVTAIEHRDYLAEIGLREIGKLLFVGPPGTGKTSVARGIAHDLGLPVVEVKLSMVTSQYLGETAKNVEKTFEVAKRLAPCILFIDEFDSVAKTRRSDEHAALKRAVNTLLKSIDDISLIRDEVLLISATNHPDQLDAAAWRRFDEIVNFPKPDRQMRADILRVITREMNIGDFDPDTVADKTEGLTGSDLRMVLREAVLEALTDDRRTITQEDIMSAVKDFEERDNLKNMDDFDNWRGTREDSNEESEVQHDHDHEQDTQTIDAND